MDMTEHNPLGPLDANDLRLLEAKGYFPKRSGPSSAATRRLCPYNWASLVMEFWFAKHVPGGTLMMERGRLCWIPLRRFGVLGVILMTVTKTPFVVCLAKLRWQRQSLLSGGRLAAPQ